MKKIRVLIADDSQTMRQVLHQLLDEDPEIKVVGEAADGAEAVTMARSLVPDVITMDVQMPQLNGLEATAAIMSSMPSRILVICSVTEGKEIDLSLRAMSAGALELIPKSRAGNMDDLRVWGKKIAEAVRLMAEVPVITRRRRALPRKPVQLGATGRVDVVGLVSSTGGPPALALILAALPSDLPVPVLIAQHMAAGFVKGLIRWFSEVTPLTVLLADEGMVARPGHIYLPPDEHDLTVDEEGLLHVVRTKGGHCPSGNKLLTSIALAYGARGLGVVMTGMGDDGAAGLLSIRTAGGLTFAQDEFSSVVYGMPQAAAANGAAKEIIPLESIAPTIIEVCAARKGIAATEGVFGDVDIGAPGSVRGGSLN